MPIGTSFHANSRLRLMTPQGERLIETLSVGDRLLTSNNRVTTVQLIARTRLSRTDLATSPLARPIRIMAGTFGEDQPNRDLLVMRSHRLMLRSGLIRKTLQHCEALIPAIALLNQMEATIDENIQEIIYYHILTERHEILLANGLPSESFHLDAETRMLLTPLDLARINALILTGKVRQGPALPIVAEEDAEQLILEIRKSGKPLIGEPCSSDPYDAQGSFHITG